MVATDQAGFHVSGWKSIQFESFIESEFVYKIIIFCVSLTGNTQAESRVGFEAAVGRSHVDGRRFEGEFAGEHEMTVIVAAVVRGLLRSADDVVPFEDVGRQRFGADVRNGIAFQTQIVLFKAGRRCAVAHFQGGRRGCLKEGEK